MVPILIHGDAAFVGEGVVAETLNLGRLDGYTVGGTIHVIINNQVGFTTDPAEARSTRYASDVAKGYDFPIIHVNADFPEECLTAVRLAMAYRAQYRDDVVIDLVGYRRHGHNEADEPSYTQPQLYSRIAGHPTVRTLFVRALMEEEVLDEAAAKAMENAVAEELRRLQVEIRAEASQTNPDDNRLPEPQRAEAPTLETSVPLDTLAQVNEAALTWPVHFQVHAKLARSLQKRREGFGPETKLEWAHAETLALGLAPAGGLRDPADRAGRAARDLQSAPSGAARSARRCALDSARSRGRGALRNLQLAAFRNCSSWIRVRLQRRDRP